ncbi:MAG: DUF1993 family protein [Candidatus Binatia bacterium]
MNPFETIRQFSRMLTNLDAWLQAGVVHAEAKGFPADVLAQSRLAPDQYSLVQQVQSACDSAKFAVAYFSGQKAPSHPDTETTIEELRARIRACLDYVDGAKASDFGPVESVRVSPAWMGGKSVPGDVYLHRLSIPNFYFHVTTAYAILRHNGVALGKGDFMGVKDFSELGAE